MSRGKIDKHALRELTLFAENDGALYRQRFQPILANQCKKVKKGTFNQKLSVVGWMHYVDDAAKRYAREFASEGDWHRMFSTATRQAFARQLAASTRTECKEHGLAGLRRRR